MVIILFIIPGCSDDIIPPPPPDPQMFAEISGYDSLHFEAVVNQVHNSDYNQYNYSGFINKNGKKYTLIFSIFYVDSDYTVGIYNFYKKPIANRISAVGSFVISVGKEDKIFMSDSGTINITKKFGMTVEGTFNFYGTLTSDSTKKIIVNNGILKLN